MIKWIILIIVTIIFLPLYPHAAGIWKERGKGSVVYTNVVERLFFAKAFRESKGDKRRIEALVRRFAKRFGLDVKLAETIAKIESDFNPDAVSKAGARGVMQLMKKTARDFGVKNLNSVEENIKGGVLFLKHLSKKYHGDLKLVAAAYNAGETAVDRYHGVPPYRETIRYVNKFLRLYNGGKRFSGSILAKSRIVKHNGVFSNVEMRLW